ncbi:MAG: SAM-dependent methyltransferase [Candidatus Brocadiales bacterium]|nr:SAM-dependent methyltransferase [Candidatus Bathyanammoxibius sp.]MCQ4574938.1 SAM-dependent methyltransferase [Candidatus Bathyanammoxibius amoris]
MSTILQDTEYSAEAISTVLTSSGEFLRALRWEGPDGGVSHREIKKFKETVGFSLHILRALKDVLDDELVFLECSCGKSYLAFALNRILKELDGMKCTFYGVDVSEALVEKCRRIAVTLDYDNMDFSLGRTREFKLPGEKKIDIVLALHACDSATDEAVARGIRLDAAYIMVVPCCHNQVRGQIRSTQPLKDLTDFGPLRYRFADLLTDALRAQVLMGAGYHVTFHEIVPPTVTPKNLVITARRLRSGKKKGMDGYRRLCHQFGVRSILEKFLPEHFNGEDG